MIGLMCDMLTAISAGNLFGVPALIAFQYYFNLYTTMPAAAEMPIKPMGEMPFLLIFREPK